MVEAMTAKIMASTHSRVFDFFVFGLPVSFFAKKFHFMINAVYRLDLDDEKLLQSILLKAIQCAPYSTFIFLKFYFGL